MALRIPTPDSVGATRLGQVQPASSAGTPFQRLSVPQVTQTPDRISDASAVTLQNVGGAVQQFAVAQKNHEVKKDKRALFSADAEQSRISNELLNNPESGLNSKLGGAAINHIKSGATDASGNPIGLVASYDEQLAAY